MKRIRILHVVHTLTRGGGVETWLMHLLKYMDCKEFQQDYVVHTSGPTSFDEEIASAGGQIFHLPRPPRTLTYGRQFRRILEQHGPYDVVHSHFYPAGYPLRWAHQAGVPVRIAHSHNAVLELNSYGTFLRWMFMPLARKWIDKHATLGLACSREAAAAKFGDAWQMDARWKILHYGIDTTPFEESVDRAEVRRDLGIPIDTFILGHVGRFVTQKNQGLLIDVAAALSKRVPDFRLLILGDGPHRARIESKIQEAGISSNIILAGVRRDVARIMIGVMDVFILTSLYEGLPLAGIEAVAAGLPLVLSNTISQEFAVIPEMVQSVSLTDSPTKWVDAILAARDRPRPARGEILTAFKKTDLNIETSVHLLANEYRQAATQFC